MWNEFRGQARFITGETIFYWILLLARFVFAISTLTCSGRWQRTGREVDNTEQIG